MIPLIPSRGGFDQQTHVSARPPRVVFADNHGLVLGKEQPSANLSLLYLASYLRDKFPGAEMTYISQKPPIEHHLRIVEEMRPDFYAVSFTSFSALQAYALIHRLKERFPWLRVVAGGPHVTALPEDALRRGGADVSVLGEGRQSTYCRTGERARLPHRRLTAHSRDRISAGGKIHTNGRAIDDRGSRQCSVSGSRSREPGRLLRAHLQQSASEHRDGDHAWLSVPVRVLRQSGVQAEERSLVSVSIAAEHSIRGGGSLPPRIPRDLPAFGRAQRQTRLVH